MNDTARPTPYEQIGGEAGVRELVTRFYDNMDAMPEAWETRKMHDEDLSSSREKLFLFLSGWLGGPNLYIEKYGHPRLRARHLPFAISKRERDQWLLCMYQAMEDMGLDTALKKQLEMSFFQTADHMRNQDEGDRFNVIS